MFCQCQGSLERSCGICHQFSPCVRRPHASCRGPRNGETVGSAALTTPDRLPRLQWTYIAWNECVGSGNFFLWHLFRQRQRSSWQKAFNDRLVFLTTCDHPAQDKWMCEFTKAEFGLFPAFALKLKCTEPKGLVRQAIQNNLGAA